MSSGLSLPIRESLRLKPVRSADAQVGVGKLIWWPPDGNVG